MRLRVRPLTALLQRAPAAGRKHPCAGGMRAWHTGVILMAGFLIAPRAEGQRGAVVFAGTVTDGASVPISMATVTLTTERAVAPRRTTTGESGTFHLQCDPAAGAALIRVQRLGFYQRLVVVPCAEGSGAFPVIRLRAVPLQLQAVMTRADRSLPPAKSDAVTVGSTKSRAMIELQPLDATDVRALAMLEPGVQGGAGGGILMNGQPESQTAVGADGTRAGGDALPQEAIRSVLVAPDGFDPIHGGFSGGRVELQTYEGGARWTGSLSAAGHGSATSLPRQAGPFDHASRFGRLSLGAGGPLVGDAVSLFAAVDLSDRHAEGATLESASAAQLTPFGITRDAATRSVAALRTLGALPLADPDISRYRKEQRGLVRLDSRMPDGGHFTLRLNGSNVLGHGIGLSPASTAVGRATADRTLGVMAQWEARLGERGRWFVRGATEDQRHESDAAPSVRGRARVTSSDSTLSAWARFGGLAPTPASRSELRQLDAGFIIPSGNDRHELRMGASALMESASLGGMADPGEIQYTSLEALLANQPAIFTRNAPTAGASARSTTVALYARDQWTPTPFSAVVYGLRLERGAVAGGREGRREGGASETSRRDWSVSPRIGFRFAAPSDRWSLSGGIGDFRGRIAADRYADALRHSDDTSLSCAGAAIREPEWTALVLGGEFSDACVASPAQASDIGSATTQLGSNFRAPHVTRGALHGILGAGLQRLDVDASVDLGWRQPVAVSTNLRSATTVLRAEGGRLLFTPLERIDAATGLIAVGAGLADPTIGSVRELRSDGRTRAMRVTTGWAGAFPLMRRQVIAGLTYSYQRAVAKTTAIEGAESGAGTTAGDPNQLVWSASEFEQRHSLQLRLIAGAGHGVKIAMVGMVASGRHFTPRVDADVNADGLINDAAFVPDPVTEADPGVARGISELLQRGTPATRACLLSQLGTIAGRSSCTGPATSNVNLQLAWTPPSQSSMTISVRVTNLSAGADYLLHGSRSLRGWGQSGFADPVLLVRRGFDPGSTRWQYAVNPSFGAARAGRAFVQPMQLQLRVRVRIGGVSRLISSGDDVMGGKTVAGMQRLLARRFVNLPRLVLEQGDSLGVHLTNAQVIRLQPIADSLQERLDVSGVQLARATILSAGGTDGGMRQALANEARALILQGIREVQATLTPEQWRLLPRHLREPDLNIPVTSVIETQGVVAPP